MTTVYDVTQWSIPGSPGVTAYTDIGAIINSIIVDIKTNQNSQAAKPGATIYLPPGDYSLKTRVIIDISFLQIKGSGHGFTSLGIRYGTPDTSQWHELNPGASHIKVENTDGNAEAFLVTRTGNPRLSSVEFRDFCIDGLTFPANYSNGKVGVRVASSHDSFVFDGMGLIFLQRALIIDSTDALTVSNNFLVECGSAVELTTSGQASKVVNNLIGAGYIGYSIFAENHEGLLIEGNNIFPVGKSMVHLRTSSRCIIAANKFKSYYSAMIVLEGDCAENLITANQFRRELPPSSLPSSGYDDLYGLIHLNYNNNTITCNLFSLDMTTAAVTPAGATPTMILVGGGAANNVANNHFASNIPATTVVLDASSTGTKVLDSGSSSQVLSYTTNYTFRATP